MTNHIYFELFPFWKQLRFYEGFFICYSYLYTMKQTLHEQVSRIKSIMNLNEETEEDLKKILKDKFPSHKFHGKFERQGDNIIEKGFSKKKNGNFILTYKTSEDFFVVEYIDGPHKGFKLKRYENKDDEIINRSELSKKFEEKIKNYPCLKNINDHEIRETGNGKIVFEFENGGTAGGVIFMVLDDNTYYFRGGKLDGEQGKFSCNGEKIKWGAITKAGTSKKVLNQIPPIYFYQVTTSNPLKLGMRDASKEPENGLIYILQKKLKELNLYDGEPDGQFGPKTYKAVVEFQKTGKDSDGKPLVKDGLVGPKTIKSLGLQD